MNNHKLDVKKLDSVIKKTIEAVNNGKSELYDIAESSRRECKKLEEELKILKEQAKEIIESVEILELRLRESKAKLMIVNKNYQKYTQEELRKAYEDADNYRVELAIKREREQQILRRRNELEVRIRTAFETVQKADSLISHIGVALGCLTGDLSNVSSKLEDVQQRQLMSLKIIKAQEEERKRVARDIHDGPAQSMSNVVMKAEICEKLIDVDIEKARCELDQLKKVVRECLQDVRKIIYNLRPMSLDDLGLIPTLQRYIMTFQDETGKAVVFRTRGVYDDIIPEISLTVFRIVQEALSNINKHAKAQNVTVNLEFMDKDLKLYIYDDGKGFKMEDLKPKGENINSGFGLYSMRERVELLDGEFSITSEPGKGTRLNISIPFNAGREG